MVNVESNPQMASEYWIRYVPTFVYVRDGREIRRKTGWASRSKLINLCRDSWW